MSVDDAPLAERDVAARGDADTTVGAEADAAAGDVDALALRDGSGEAERVRRRERNLALKGKVVVAHVNDQCVGHLLVTVDTETDALGVRIDRDGDLAQHAAEADAGDATQGGVVVLDAVRREHRQVAGFCQLTDRVDKQTVVGHTDHSSWCVDGYLLLVNVLGAEASNNLVTLPFLCKKVKVAASSIIDIKEGIYS